ncbi:Metallophosphatase [Rubrivivax sp. A210]|uniref:metallophosphoesterase family protein n=1 Tax=Rubrivivax sp. A210 TaxID=2772301 RepID=UPI001918435C|nr:metallophosphoesterase [Rubrivivax sp. A210]CAD5371689.1 Metallophosphatase [Rubrivivax sp. A210]
MPTLLHTADWQIGRQYGVFAPDDAAALAEARYTAVERLAALATAEKVDAVVVAGDVFDAQTVSARSIRRLFNALAAYAGPWVMIPGNHDAALAESVWSHALRLQAVPDNVYLALQPRVVELAASRLALLCAPLTQRHTHGDLSDWFDGAETPDGWWRIGVAHGAVQGLLADEIDSANPIAPDRAVRARLDYLALGDWHGTKCIDARTWYSGTPEPDRFKGNDPGQALLVSLAEPGTPPRVRPVAVAQFRWQQLAARLDVASDLDGLIARLEALGAPDVIDLQLSGHIDLAGQARLQAALGAAEARLRCLRSDLGGLRLAPTDEDIAALHVDGWLGELVAELRGVGGAAGAAAGDDPRRAQDALALLTGLLVARGAGAA